MALDTFANFEELTKAGMPKEQARVLVDQQKAIVDGKEVVSKSFLKMQLARQESRIVMKLVLWQVGIAVVLAGFLFSVLH